MPWRNTGLIQEVLLALGTSVAVVMGLLAKIAHEVKSGERERFFTRRLWLDAPALVVMITIAAGINLYFDLTGWPASAVAAVCGWAGPRSIDLMLLALADRVRGGKK
ncbi:MAG TPA: hypothetical protein DCQ42_14840 [Halomonas sp.]|mgnify:FL=1|jgi:hypothetical protein|nr:hypothetical protein [uncultured Halomonas sp.]HAO02950.1 hypothetical protein [Halomonas sp.]|tara:strand:+ start:529 stop:849 length:321 start_codon:yes stop_codon:yes gene_type:complete